MDLEIKCQMEKYANALEKQRQLANALETAIEEIFSKPSVKPSAPVAMRQPAPKGQTPVTKHQYQPEHKHQSGESSHQHDISSPYGERVHPVTGKVTMHRGIDLRGPEGTPVRAYDDGVVLSVSYNNTSGNFIVIQHRNGITSSYSHLSSQDVSKGERVFKGQQIGAVGQTGRVTGPHLHFRLKQKGTDVDPEPYIQDRRIVG